MVRTGSAFTITAGITLPAALFIDKGGVTAFRTQISDLKPTFWLAELLQLLDFLDGQFLEFPAGVLQVFLQRLGNAIWK